MIFNIFQLIILYRLCKEFFLFFNIISGLLYSFIWIYYIIYVKNYDTFKISIYNLRWGQSDLYYLESNAQADGVHDLFDLMAVLTVTINQAHQAHSRRLPPPSWDHVLEFACKGDGGGSDSGVVLMEDI